MFDMGDSDLRRLCPPDAHRADSLVPGLAGARGRGPVCARGACAAVTPAKDTTSHGSSRSNSAGWLAPAQAGVFGAREAQDGDPLAVVGRLPDQLSVQDLGGLGGAHVLVEAKVACVGGCVGVAEVEAARRRVPLGGEEQGKVVVVGLGRSLFDLCY
jgi:hypothetical protein